MEQRLTDGLGSQSFDIDFARDLVTYGADNNSSSHTYNRKNDVLVLKEGPTDDINGTINAAEKNFNIDFSKAKTNFFS